MLRFFYRATVFLVGFSTLLTGILLIVLPGPAFLVIPLGLGILATEFFWAKRLFDRVQSQIRKRRPRDAGSSTKKARRKTTGLESFDARVVKRDVDLIG